MKNKLFPMLAAALILPTLTACGGTAGSTPDPTPTLSATGTWDGTETFVAQHGAEAQDYAVRYIINDNSGTLTGSVYSCVDRSFNCLPLSLTGSREGNMVTLIYSDAKSIVVKTTATLSGNSLSGETQYTRTYIFNGKTTLTKK